MIKYKINKNNKQTMIPSPFLLLETPKVIVHMSATVLVKRTRVLNMYVILLNNMHDPNSKQQINKHIKSIQT